MTNNVLVPEEQIQLKNTIVENVDGVNQVTVLDQWNNISLFNEPNIAILLGIIFGLLVLIAVMSWSYKITRLGDKSS